MNDFFLDCLRDLKVLRGINQYEDLLAKGEKGKQEGRKLIQALIATCGQFNYIPDEVKQRVIRQRILDDPDFYNLNASKVWHWLNGVAGKYYNHGSTDAPISNAEPLSENTQKLISDFMARLLSGQGMKGVPTASNAELEAIRNEDANREKRTALSASYRLDPAYVRELELKIEWARLNTNLLTGAILPGSPSFDEWVANQ